MTISPTPGPLDPPTPAFVIDRPLLDEFLSRFQGALDRHWPHSIIGYSFKTNSLPWLVAHMHRRGTWAEVVSDDEYDLALAVGYPPDEIILNGPTMSREHLRFALTHGSIVNLDSRRAVTWAAELARERPGTDVAVGLRVSWDLESLCPGESTAGPEGGRFGFPVAGGDLDRAIAELTGAGARIAGLHMHRNSMTKSPAVYRAACEVATELIRSRGLELDWLDIGGGFFGSVGGSPSFDEYVAVIRETLDPVVDATRTRLVVEPGGALVAVPIEMQASVLDVKEVAGHTFVVTDTSRTDIDPLYRDGRQYEMDVRARATSTCPEQIICGYTLAEIDRIVRLTDAPTLSVGDRLLFRRVGAYTMSFQSTFIDFLPAVYVRHEDSLALVRRRWRAQDYLQGNHWEGDGVPVDVPAERAAQPDLAGLTAAAGPVAVGQLPAELTR